MPQKNLSNTDNIFIAFGLISRLAFIFTFVNHCNLN
jgi:hypothetical protein